MSTSSAPVMDAPQHDARPLSSLPSSSPSSRSIVPPTHAQGTTAEMATKTTVAGAGTGAEKEGFFRRAIDSFKPPPDQKGWVPDRVPRDVNRVVTVDAEKGAVHRGGANVEVDKEGGSTSVVEDDALDDNGGLKRALHGRHLQVCLN